MTRWRGHFKIAEILIQYVKLEKKLSALCHTTRGYSSSVCTATCRSPMPQFCLSANRRDRGDQSKMCHRNPWGQK